MQQPQQQQQEQQNAHLVGRYLKERLLDQLPTRGYSAARTRRKAGEGSKGMHEDGLRQKKLIIGDNANGFLRVRENNSPRNPKER